MRFPISANYEQHNYIASDALHFHEKIMASVQIRLGQTNSHWQGGCSVQPFALVPRGGKRIPALMNGVFVRSRGSQHTGSKCAQDQKGGLHFV